MDTPTKRTAPTGILLGIALVWCWPHITTQSSFVQESADFVKLAPDWLAPAVSGKPAQNPFGVITPAQVVRRPVKHQRPVQTKDPVAKDIRRETSPNVFAQREFTPADQAALLNTFRLNGTWVSDSGGFAVVNDRVREVGDQLGTWDIGHPITVHRIESSHVILAMQDKTLVLRPVRPTSKAARDSAPELDRNPANAVARQRSAKSVGGPGADTTMADILDLLSSATRASEPSAGSSARE